MKPLTPRETQCLVEMANGSTIKEVGNRLGISDQTVKNRLAAAYEKLDVHGHVDAFLALGWLQPPEIA